MKYFTDGEKGTTLYCRRLDSEKLIEYLYIEYRTSRLKFKRFAIQ